MIVMAEVRMERMATTPGSRTDRMFVVVQKKEGHWSEITMAAHET